MTWENFVFMQEEGEAISMTWRPGSMEAGGLGGKEKENRNGKIFIPSQYINLKKKTTTLSIQEKWNN